MLPSSSNTTKNINGEERQAHGDQQCAAVLFSRLLAEYE
jgi:hypothetical protein